MPSFPRLLDQHRGSQFGTNVVPGALAAAKVPSAVLSAAVSAAVLPIGLFRQP